jgi:hypothetical protein
MRNTVIAIVAALLGLQVAVASPALAAWPNHHEGHPRTLSPFGALNADRVRANATYYYHGTAHGLTSYKVVFDVRDRYYTRSEFKCSLLEKHAISNITVEQYRGRYAWFRFPTGGGCHFTRYVNTHTPTAWAYMHIKFKVHVDGAPDVWYNVTSQFNKFGTI